VGFLSDCCQASVEDIDIHIPRHADLCNGTTLDTNRIVFEFLWWTETDRSGNGIVYSDEPKVSLWVVEHNVAIGGRLRKVFA